jgi:hypothetical protein
MIRRRTEVGSETSHGRSEGTVPKGVTDHAMHLEVLHELALRLSGERSVDAVLQLLVGGLAQQSDVVAADSPAATPHSAARSPSAAAEVE